MTTWGIRVATVTFQKIYDIDPEVYDHASHYSYDIAGNVKTLIQDIPELEPYTQRFKRIDYQYDLISGKVNNVNFQKDSIDQFIHQYAYDEENRIIQTKTSADGLLWDIDADYQYYAHGPLARIELGERQIQGIDYAYTIQGWLKGINGLNLNFRKEMGKDGNTTLGSHRKFGRDVFGMVIGYFAGDYHPADATPNFEPTYASSTFNSASPGLFNGNIRNIGYTIKGLTPLTIGYAYEYDQLNRLNNVKPYDTFDGTNYKWSTSGSGMTAYKETLTYDANGNIITYLRKGAVSQVNMDNMTYNYVAGTNKLIQVEDAVNAANYSIDIDQQVSTNYLYDNSGNLIKDKKEKLDITWTAYGKVDSIYNDNTDLAINFNYDASQNRLSKRVITTASSDTVTNYYIRDAQGNIMAIYELKEDTVRWIEQDVYGSSRLGVLNPDSVVYPGTAYSQYFHHLQGKKQYELTNHLGNVLTTINDRKIGVDTATTDGHYDYWLAAQINGQDYYSGGMVMPDRSFSYENYGFGFNGKPKDDEVKGEANHYDYGERVLDPRVSRFLSVDPFHRKYAWYTPYQFAGNKFIAALDLDGLEDIVFHNIDNVKRVAKVDINKIGLIVTSGNNRIHQSQLLNSSTINSLYQRGNTTLYVDKLPKDDGSVQFKFISQKKYSKAGFKLEIQYNVSLQNATTLQDAVKTTNSDQDLYSIIGVPFNPNETYLSEGTQLNKFINSKGNTVASGAAGGSYVWINPEYFGASPTYTTNEGQPNYTFQLSGNETIAHELGHNLVPKSDHDPNNTGNPVYPNQGLKSNQPGAVYPTTDDTKKILLQNLKRIRLK